MCLQNDFRACGMLSANSAPILRQNQHYLQLDRIELPLEPHHQGVPSGVSKTISEPMVYFVPNVHNLAPTLTLSPHGPKGDFTRPTSPRSSITCVQYDLRAYGTFNTKHAHVLRQNQHYLRMDRNKLSLEPHHQGVPSGVSKMIYEPMVRLAQTVHLSCAQINTISKQTKTSFHLSHIPQSTIGYAQNDFHARGSFGANRAPTLRRD